MSPFRLRYLQPANEQDFELLCLTLLKHHWHDGTPELYGRRGQTQYGVDILDLSGKEPLRAAQCKHCDPQSPLSPNVICDEVEKAKQFSPSLGRYLFLTSAKASTQAQDAVVRINQAHSKTGFFQVELLAWPQIECLLDQYAEAVRQISRPATSELESRAQYALLGTAERFIAPAHTPFGTSSDPADSDIDEARDHITQGQPQLGRLLLERIRRRSWDRLTTRQRFRVLSNIGAALVREGRPEDAARHFLQAKPLQPDDEAALANEARGLAILGKIDDAHEAADNALSRFPHSPAVLAIWISTAPPNRGLSELLEGASPAATSGAEAKIAIAERALSAGDPATAESCARAATEVTHPEGYAWLLLGQAILADGVRNGLEAPGCTIADSARPRLREAEDCLSRALESFGSSSWPSLRATGLLNRSHVRELLQEQEAANEDVRQAREVAPDSAPVLRDYARLQIRSGQRPQAIDTLRRACGLGDGPEVRFLLAMALMETGGQNELQEAAALLADLATGPGAIPKQLREDAIFRAIDAFSSGQLWERAQAMIEALPEAEVSAVVREVAAGRLSLSRGDDTGANTHASQALDKLSGASAPQDVRRAAALLDDLGRRSEALELWRRVASASALTDDTRKMLNCASTLGNDQVLLETCERLRNAGVDDPTLLRLEADVRLQYSTQDAVVILNEFLARHPDDKEARLWLSSVGIRNHMPELIASDPQDLPDPEDTADGNWPLMVAVLRRGGDALIPIAFAYKLLRGNRWNPNAHRAFMLSMSPQLGPQAELSQPNVAEPGTAVCYREDGSERDEWVFLEDDGPVEQDWQEVANDSPVAMALAGKAVGDAFQLGTHRRAVVRAILNKYVRRYQDCLEQWEKRFPHIPAIQMVRVPDPRQVPDRLEAFAPILRSLDDGEAHLARVKDLYVNNPLSLEMLGESLGRGAFEATLFAAGEPGLPVRCSSGAPQEILEGLAAARAAGTIVLDLTAAATLFALERGEIIQALRGRLAISNGTFAALRQMTEEWAPRTEPLRSIGKADGHYTWTEISPEDQRERHRKIDGFVAELERAASVLPAYELSAVSKVTRDTLEKLFGWHGAESIAIASKPGSILWTDDLPLRQVARADFGVRSTWTQAVMASLAENGAISDAASSESSAKLIGWGYAFTSMSARSMAEAGRLADWEPDAWPLKQALDEFGDDAVNEENLAQLAATFLRSLRQSVFIPERRVPVIIRIAERLYGRRRGPALCRALLQALPLAFGLDVLGAQEATEVLAGWFRTRPLRFPPTGGPGRS